MFPRLRKLSQYYELIAFTILPREIVTKVFDAYPDIGELFSHVLTMEDLEFCEGFVYRDLGLLSGNRGDDCEILVVDSQDAELVSDA